MNERFVAVDVETANANMASICQIGVVVFAGDAVESRWSTLVDPEDHFDGMNVSIHGIDEEAVRGAPTFPDVEGQLRRCVSGSIVVSHMPFDRIAIKRACDKYSLAEIECTWLDSAKVTRRTWPQFSQRGYGLASIASWLRIEFSHHDAEEDARAAGYVLLHAIKESGLSVAEWVDRAEKPIGSGNDPSLASAQRKGNPEGPLAGGVVVGRRTGG